MSPSRCITCGFMQVAHEGALWCECTDPTFVPAMDDPAGDEPIEVNFDEHLRWLETGGDEAWPPANASRLVLRCACGPDEECLCCTRFPKPRHMTDAQVEASRRFMAALRGGMKK